MRIHICGRLIVVTNGFVKKTQKQVSERTGLAQAEISKLENGTRNPSVKLPQRLADGLGYVLKVEFVPKSDQQPVIHA